jgi:hypothetical protein
MSTSPAKRRASSYPAHRRIDMLDIVIIILLILGFACFALAAFGVTAKVNLTALGLAFWILTVLIPALGGL